MLDDHRAKPLRLFLYKVKVPEELKIETQSEERNDAGASEHENSSSLWPSQKTDPVRCDYSYMNLIPGVNIEDYDSKDSKSDLETKLWIPLYIPNYKTDFSVAATDETSENDLEVSKDITNISHEDLANLTEWLNRLDYCIPTTSQQNEFSCNESASLIQIVDQSIDSRVTPCLSLSQKIRIRGFILDIMPDPSKNPIDLVSGYCKSGCQKLFLFSVIQWRVNGIMKPICPECILQELEKELIFMFTMEMIIFEENGNHISVVVMRKHAEHFFQCSAKEFLEDPSVRNSRVQLLSDCTVQVTRRKNLTPPLDITVVVIPVTSSSIMPVLVDSILPGLS